MSAEKSLTPPQSADILERRRWLARVGNLLGTVYYHNKTISTFSHVAPADEVIGSDGNSYQCIQDNQSSAPLKPITGPLWPSYWTLGGSATQSWQDGFIYLRSRNIYSETMFSFAPPVGTLLLGEFQSLIAQTGTDGAVLYSIHAFQTKQDGTVRLLDPPTATSNIARFIGLLTGVQLVALHGKTKVQVSSNQVDIIEEVPVQDIRHFTQFVPFMRNA